MQKAGFFFVATGIFLALFFIVDLWVARDHRTGQKLDSQLMDDHQDGAEIDEDDLLPEPMDPVLESILTPDDRPLTEAELRLIYSNADYEYTVQDGDTVDTLAKKYLGDYGLRNVIYEFNHRIGRETVLRRGEKITIPLRFRR